VKGRRSELARIHARRRRVLALCFFSALLGLVVLSAIPRSAGAEGGGGALVAEPVLTATAYGVKTLFGASPGEASGEIWGAGESAREQGDIVRYTDAGGWEAMPDPIDSEGNPVPLSNAAIPAAASAGRTTYAGGLVAAASLGSIGGEGAQALIVRNPGGPLRAVEAPGAPLLEGSEKLFAASSNSSSVRLAAVEEPGGETGAFVVPTVNLGTVKAVLHYAGGTWSREAICTKPAPEPCGARSTGFSPIAIESTGPGNSWLLARQQTSSERGSGHLELLRREGTVWRPQALSANGLTSLFGKETVEPSPGVKVKVAIREKGQPLTVTSQGVWVDATLTQGAESSDATFFYNPEKGEVTGSWCNLIGGAATMCHGELPSQLPAGEGRSFGWPGGGAPTEEFGSRTITGVGQGAILIFEHGGFTKVPLDGNGGSAAGAALTSPDEGWLGPSYHLTRAPIASGLQPWPVPFRRPLTAIAPQPGATVGALGSQAIAVGDEGQVARYTVGVGWQPEALLTGSGAAAKPDLRGVAWPEPGFAYAVGSEGAMWMWRAGTGLWEPDPGAPTNLVRGNFTGIAFQPGEPDRGYAVGKQGLLLGYGRRWTQESLPAGVDPEVNITSIAFAGSEALATYTIPVSAPNGGVTYEGGLLVNDGGGWQVEEEAAKVLEGAEAGQEGVAPRRVAGLPDGGAVIAGVTGGVIEREGPGAPWHVVPGGPLGYPVAVAAIREGGQLRAILSVEGNANGTPTISAERTTDEPQAIGKPSPGQPPLLTSPYPLPKDGFIVRQTATGWRDEQHQSYAAPEHVVGQSQYDLPRVPDAVLALLLNPESGEGWAVGGNTGEDGGATFSYQREGVQTGSVVRVGAAASPPENVQKRPIQIPAKAATFAIGGNAACVGPCASLAGAGIGPDVWLRSAVGKAAEINGLRAFLYTGTGVASGLSGLGRLAFGEEEAAYARRLGAAAGALPVYAAPSESDLFEASPTEKNLSVFAAEFEGFPEPFGKSPLPVAGGVVAGEAAADPSVNDSYWFESTSLAGENPVRVIVLDYSIAPLSGEKECWLATQLAIAKARKVPAIVVGNREVGSEAELRRILVTGEDPLCPLPEPGAASAYFFKVNANRQQTLNWEGASIPAYGTGTLGYVPITDPGTNQHSPASGFLLAAVGEPNPLTDVAPVTVSLVPNVSSLAIYATDGTLLRRSQPALFEALARRPVAGYSCIGSNAPSACESVSPDPYVQIPDRCIRGFEGASCASEIPAEYRFTSSHPDIANFVEVDPASTNPRAVYLKNGKPVADPESGLLCAFNAGTTTVTVETGGLAYSTPVTVQAGSVSQPCGTVPLENPPVLLGAPTVPPPPPTPNPGPNFTPQGGAIPTPPGPPAPITHLQPQTQTPPPVHNPIKPPAPASLPYFLNPNPIILPVPVIVPPPPAPVLEPTPPTGTSPITEPASSPETEEEDETAFDLVHQMSAYRHQRAPGVAATLSSSSGGGPSIRFFVPALVLLLALAGAGVATPRRRPSKLAYEPRATSRRL
jgi:hypothetical protein